MKVLHIFREKNKGDVGGVEYHIQYLAAEQLKLGLSPSVLSFSLDSTNGITYEKRNNIDWVHLTLKQGRFIKFLLQGSNFFSKTGFLAAVFERILHNFIIGQKLKTINQIDPNVIHQHDYLSSVRLSKKLAKKYKTIFTNHYGEYLFLKKTKLTNYLQGFFLNHFDAIIASSKELLPEMNNCYQIFNGVDTNIFLEITNEEKGLLKSKVDLEDKITFLCARRWAPTKGVIHLAEALNLLDERIQKKIALLFAGNESDDFQKYKMQVQSELDKCTNVDIRLFGNIKHDKLSQLINISDIGVIPSLMEGISLFSIELISCGIPVLATNVGGIPEIVIHNKNGWLVPPGNSIKIAEEITRIVLNWPDSNLEIETAEFRKSYSWVGISQQTVEIYKIN